MRFALQIRCVIATFAALGALVCATPGVAMAKPQDPLVPSSISLESLDIVPQAFKLSGRDAIRIASRLPLVKKERAQYGRGLKAGLGIPTYYTKRPIRFEVS